MRSALLALVLLSSPVLADSPKPLLYDGRFGDASLAVEGPIVERGLVTNFVSHVGQMVHRTGADGDSGTRLLDVANIFLFCSAIVSRKVIEAEATNIQYCPYGFL